MKRKSLFIAIIVIATISILSIKKNGSISVLMYDNIEALTRKDPQGDPTYRIFTYGYNSDSTTERVCSCWRKKNSSDTQVYCMNDYEHEWEQVNWGPYCLYKNTTCPTVDGYCYPFANPN